MATTIAPKSLSTQTKENFRFQSQNSISIYQKSQLLAYAFYNSCDPSQKQVFKQKKIYFNWLTLSEISNTYYAYAVWALLATPVSFAVVAAACQKLCMLHTPQATCENYRQHQAIDLLRCCYAYSFMTRVLLLSGMFGCSFSDLLSELSWLTVLAYFHQFAWPHSNVMLTDFE